MIRKRRIYFDENTFVEILDEGLIICQGKSYMSSALLFMGMVMGLVVSLLFSINFGIKGIILLIIPIVAIVAILSYYQVSISFSSNAIKYELNIAEKMSFKIRETKLNGDLFKIEVDETDESIAYYLSIDGKRILTFNSEVTCRNFQKVIRKNFSTNGTSPFRNL